MKGGVPDKSRKSSLFGVIVRQAKIGFRCDLNHGLSVSDKKALVRRTIRAMS